LATLKFSPQLEKTVFQTHTPPTVMWFFQAQHRASQTLQLNGIASKTKYSSKIKDLSNYKNALEQIEIGLEFFRSRWSLP